MLKNDKLDVYSGKKAKVALAISEGIRTHTAIAKEFSVHITTISRWKQDPAYKSYIDKLTLDNELASRAGMLRALYRGADIKAGGISEDKSTHLDYMKEIGNVQGFKTQKLEHSGSIEQKVEIYLPQNNRDTAAKLTQDTKTDDEA